MQLCLTIAMNPLSNVARPTNLFIFVSEYCCGWIKEYVHNLLIFIVVLPGSGFIQYQWSFGVKNCLVAGSKLPILAFRVCIKRTSNAATILSHQASKAVHHAYSTRMTKSRTFHENEIYCLMLLISLGVRKGVLLSILSVAFFRQQPVNTAFLLLMYP